jgi:hypothetical protein
MTRPSDAEIVEILQLDCVIRYTRAAAPVVLPTHVLCRPSISKISHEWLIMQLILFHTKWFNSEGYTDIRSRWCLTRT